MAKKQEEYETQEQQNEETGSETAKGCCKCFCTYIKTGCKCMWDTIFCCV